MNKRVVVTGMGCVSPYGEGTDSLIKGIESDTNPFSNTPIRVSTDNFSSYPVGYALLKDTKTFDIYMHSITPLSYYAYISAVEALTNANITKQDSFYTDIGISISSTMSSYSAYKEILDSANKNPRMIPVQSIYKSMTHSPAIQVASQLDVSGKCLSNNAACAGGLLSIISGYELIKLGKQNIMLCGGTEEHSNFLTFMFRKLGIASKDKCKPFDKDRDGIVVSEGAGILVLEELDHARARGATIYGEILGSGYNKSDNLAYSDKDSIANCMLEAMTEAKLTTDNTLFLINAHATGTTQGDIEEGQAISSIFQDVFPLVNSLKGYFGHTMAASGAIELIASIIGLRKHTFYNTKNCNEYDEECGLSILPNQEVANSSYYTLMKNSIGLGGMNTSLIVNIKAEQ